jgi:hypothetical protein
MRIAECGLRNKISEQSLVDSEPQESRSQDTEARIFFLLNSDFCILDSFFTIHHSLFTVLPLNSKLET